MREVDWEGSAKKWQQAEDAIAKLQPSNDFAPIHKITQGKVHAINQAWGVILTASKNKDKVAFLSAKEALSIAMGDLGLIADEGDKTLGELLTQLEHAKKS